MPRWQRGATEELAEDFSVADAGVAGALLLERESELDQIGAVLSVARQGSGRVVLIEGPAGIGKTRLLEEARDRAHALGFDVLAARGGELESGHGFGVARQLLEVPLARASAEDRSDILSGAAVLAEAVFSTTVSGPPAATETVLHGLYWLMANLSERAPLLLAIDDVHSADAPSLRFLLYLARRLEGMPVVLALTLRTGEVSHEAQVLQTLRLEADAPVLEPSALSPRATRTLAAARLDCAVTEDLGRACHDATRGNPFLLMELMHELRGTSEGTEPAAIGRMASQRIATAILLRIGRLGGSAAALVRATAVLGMSADLDTAAALTGLDGATAAGLVDALARAEILGPGAPSRALRFVHPLVRSAVYEDIPPSQRAQLHAQAAQLLAHRRGGTDAAAMHLLLSEPAGDEDAVERLREAARAAMARGAPETAAEFLRRAAREPPPATARPAVLRELGAAAWRAGHPDGVELLRDAFQSAPGQPARALAGHELAFALGVSANQSIEAIEVLERARVDLHDEELLMLLDARLAMFASAVPAARVRLAEHLRQARTVLERPQTNSLLALLSPLTADLVYTGAPAADVVRLADRALVDGQLMWQDIATDSDFALAAVTSLIYAGCLRAARHHVDAGIADARARGSPFALARISAYRAWIYWRLGELPTAESDAELALSVRAAWGIPHAISTAVLAAVRIERGDLDGARAAFANLDADPAALEVTPNQLLRETRAMLLLAEGDPQGALAELHAYARWEQQAGLETRLGPVAWRSAAALVHMQLGETDEARELAVRELQLAREFAAAPQLGAALRALAIVEGVAEGLALLEEAICVLDASGARLDHARALMDLGALLGRCGQRTRAIETLREARELAHRCGATMLVDSAATQLRLAGARPRRIALSGRESLTPSERRVADLAVEGMTNKQIAQALFVTLRTVEMHLSNAYRKLSIASREQLPAALAAE